MGYVNALTLLRVALNHSGQQLASAFGSNYIYIYIYTSLFCQTIKNHQNLALAIAMAFADLSNVCALPKRYFRCAARQTYCRY